MPKRLNSARPAPLSSMNGYSSTPASWAASRTAEGSRRANLSTACTLALASVGDGAGE